MVRTFSQAALPLVLLLSVSYAQASDKVAEKQPLAVNTGSHSEPSTPKSSTSSAANASAAPATTVTTPTAADHENPFYTAATGRPTQLSHTPATASSSSSRFCEPILKN